MQPADNQDNIVQMQCTPTYISQNHFVGLWELNIINTLNIVFVFMYDCVIHLNHNFLVSKKMDISVIIIIITPLVTATLTKGKLPSL